MDSHSRDLLFVVAANTNNGTNGCFINEYSYPIGYKRSDFSYPDLGFNIKKRLKTDVFLRGKKNERADRFLRNGIPALVRILCILQIVQELQIPQSEGV